MAALRILRVQYKCGAVQALEGDTALSLIMHVALSTNIVESMALRRRAVVLLAS